MANFRQMISELEAERNRINHAIIALQKLEPGTVPFSAGPQPQRSRKRLSQEAKDRISEAMRQRWAQRKAAAASA